MCISYYFCIFCIIIIDDVLCEADTEKRLVLHSEADLSQELINLRSEFESYKSQSTSEINALKNAAIGTRAVYVRWGRNICPVNAELVYKGFIGGKKYSDTGSGTTHLCLPSDPTWGRFNDNANTNRGKIYGTEIDHDDHDNIFHNHVSQQDMPCAVCETNTSTSLMIPARIDCYQGWQLEYTGYLMAGYTGSAGSYDHICLDDDPEFLQHGGTNDNQHVLYMIEGQCGSLPCPPYVQYRELACVVCSK